MADMTTVRVSTATRDRLNALVAKGQTLEEAVAMLIDTYEQVKLNERLAWEAKVAAARADTQAWARGERIAARVRAELDQRAASRR